MKNKNPWMNGENERHVMLMNVTHTQFVTHMQRYILLFLTPLTRHRYYRCCLAGNLMSLAG